MGVALQDILERKEILLKHNNMNNEEKVKKMLECDRCPFRKGKDSENNCNTCFDKKLLLKIAQWKDEQFKQLLIEKTKLLSPSAAQDSVKRCTFEEIYREMFNEEMPNSNPYIK